MSVEAGAGAAGGLINDTGNIAGVDLREESAHAAFIPGDKHDLEDLTVFHKQWFLANLAQLILTVLLIHQFPLDFSAATCTGADPCHACKNCKYCKHCAKDGGKCGVCK